MRRDNTDLVVVAGAAVVAGGVQLLTIPLAGAAALVPRLLTGIPLALVLPGCALSLLLSPAAAFPRGGGMPWLRLGMWSIGLSLLVTVLGGLLLNLTPMGLTQTGWAVLLTAVTLLAVAGVAIDRHRRPVGRPAAAGPPLWRRPGTLRTAGYGLGAVVAVTAAIWLSYSGAAGQTRPDFAQLWLVPADSATATLGVRNDRGDAESYAVVLRNGDAPDRGWEFTLGAGESWQQAVPITVGQQVKATLTEPGRSTAPQVVELRPAAPTPTP